MLPPLAIFRLRARRAFVMLPDMITAMCIVAGLLAVLSIALGARHRTESRLSDQLLALRQTEATLSALQNRAATPRHGGIASNIRITPLPGNWARVTVQINHATASLIGPTKGAP